MSTYRVAWTSEILNWTDIEADSEKNAIEKVKGGDRPDTDTDDAGKERKFHCI
tara:strand:+ start:602 stop:760 length:159 start_codon:yes stop_codon:yes gene_type:complete